MVHLTTTPGLTLQIAPRFWRSQFLYRGGIYKRVGEIQAHMSFGVKLYTAMLWPVERKYVGAKFFFEIQRIASLDMMKWDGVNDFAAWEACPIRHASLAHAFLLNGGAFPKALPKTTVMQVGSWRNWSSVACALSLWCPSVRAWKISSLKRLSKGE